MLYTTVVMELNLDVAGRKEKKVESRERWREARALAVLGARFTRTDEPRKGRR